MIKQFRKYLIAAAGAAAMSVSAADAATIERKLGSFDSPLEWRLKCNKWIKPWKGAKICRAHTYQQMRHSFVLRASGPDIDEAARNVLNEAFAAAVTAAVGVGVLTPSPEPFARVAAAISAAKTAFVAYLAARGLERLATQYSISIDHSAGWA